ncbi:MAG: VOC family protein [Caulobacterales bacterium]
MTVHNCTALLNVADVERSLAFWQAVLGFEVVTRFEPDGRLMFAMLQSGETPLMLNGRGSDPAERRARSDYTDAVLYFRVDDVRETYAMLRANGVEVGEPQAQEYGLDEIILRDPDGYEIAFTSPTDFARRSV